MYLKKKLNIIENTLRIAWNKDTCLPSLKSKWNIDIPEIGQCAVTALLIQDYLGGEILHNKEFDHYYNRLPGGFIVDLTKKQFGNTYATREIVSVSRGRLISPENESKALTLSRYMQLKKRFQEELRRKDLLLVEEKEHTERPSQSHSYPSN